MKYKAFHLPPKLHYFILKRLNIEFKKLNYFQERTV